MHTSAGSIALTGSYAVDDSFVASQLKLAGAVLLGKTNMSERANFMSNYMLAGYSSRGGQVKNPYGPGELFVRGSSSGSAAAIAANLGAAIMLGALTGVDERDEATLSSENYSYTDYTAFLDDEFIKKARIGIARFYYKDLDQERLTIAEEAIHLLKNAGAT